MTTATHDSDFQRSRSTDFEPPTIVESSSSPPLDDWWTRAPSPRAPRSPRGRISASTSLGSEGFASFREVGAGLVGVVEVSVGDVAAEPINIATPLRRASSRAASSAASPNGSSPASQFLAAFSPPKTDLLEGDGHVVGEYTLGKKIGEGAFSEVRKATNTDTGAVVAIKIVKKDKPGSSLGDRESAIWFNLSHDNVLPLFSTFDTPYATYLVMLLCPAGSLLQVIHVEGPDGLTQHRAGDLFVDVVTGLKYLHLVANIVHGDLKLENVLVDEHGHCRIADFTLARPIGAPAYSRPPTPPDDAPLMRSHTMPRHRPAPKSRPTASNQRQNFHPGSLEYAAPELLRVSSSDAEFADPAQDIWALGCILHALLTGRLPFADSFQPRLQMKIVRGTWDIPPNIGRRATELLQGCLEMQVLARLTVEQVEQSQWVQRWKDRSSTSGSRDRLRARSTSRDAYRAPSADHTRPHQERRHSHDALRSYSRERGSSLPCLPRTPSAEDSLPPLSPPFLPLLRGRQGFVESESLSRSPSLGTPPGPGTPLDGQSPMNQVHHHHRSTSRGRIRLVSPLTVSGLEVLDEASDLLMSSSSGAGESAEPHRGRRTNQRRLVSSPSPLRAAHHVAFEAYGVGSKDDSAAVWRRRSRERERVGGEGQAEGRRSRSVGHARRSKSRGRGEDELGDGL